MSPSLILAVAAGGLVGAPCRYLLDRAVSRRIVSDLPWGTFAVNMSGCLALGLLTGLDLAHHVPAVLMALIGVGFCGAYTTFSTFNFETVQLFEDGHIVEAAANVAASVVVGIAIAGVGVAIGLAL
jgi:fluoride exporter